MTTELFKFKPGTVVQRPYSIEPYSLSWENKVTWVEMKPRRIVNQGTSGRGGSLVGGDEGPTFKFIAPNTIAENIGHTWGAYDSIQSRIADKAIGAAKLGRDLTSVAGALPKIGGSLLKGVKGSNYGTALEDVVRSAYTSVGGHNVPKIKVDKPSIYQDSQRRQLVLEFQLIAEKLPKNDVLDVVQDLQKYSCAGISRRSDIDIEFPYYFEVKTTPGEAINYSTCALMAVQSTYNIPWSDGYPSQCTLQLTFEDISPLFRQTIQSGSLINVIDSAEYVANNENTSSVRSEFSSIETARNQSLNQQRNVQTQRALGSYNGSNVTGQGQGYGSTPGI